MHIGPLFLDILFNSMVLNVIFAALRCWDGWYYSSKLLIILIQLPICFKITPIVEDLGN